MDVSELRHGVYAENRTEKLRSILPQLAVMLICIAIAFAMVVMLVQIRRMDRSMTDLNRQVQVLQTELQERENEIETLTAEQSGQN